MIPMIFETKPHKFQGHWTYQAQFHNYHKANQAKEWLSGRFNPAKHKFSGDSFFTNELQDIFDIRIQFDQHLKAVRRADSFQ